MAKTNRQKIILVALLLFAFFLRIWRIDRVPVSLFSDELDVGYQAYSILTTGKDYFGNPWPLHFQSYADVRTPLYIYSAVPSVFVFGITPLGVRLPAVVFGVLGIWLFYLLTHRLTKNKNLALFSACVMTISPWHLQYSRAGFEATMLLFFLLLGLYLYLLAVEKPKYLWLCVVVLVATAWVYSTAKLFTPLLLVFLLFRKKTLSIPKSEIVKAAIAGLVIGLPLIYVTVFSGGGYRANYTSVFTDPVAVPESNYAILLDNQVEGASRGLVNKIASRFYHNKYGFWTEKIVNNYLRALSTNFLFVTGDINLRHSPEGIGEFYKIEIVTMALGAALFFLTFTDKWAKSLMAFWFLTGILPAAVTRDGGDHATRLILVLPVLIFFVAFGFIRGFGLLKDKFRLLAQVAYVVVLLGYFWSYQHNYWIHNPWYSERSWHAGYKEMVSGIKEAEGGFDKIIITNAVEPPEIFFAAYYPYPPDAWQRGFTTIDLPGFGELKSIGKYYFGQMGEEGVSELDNYLDQDTLYIAAEREVGENLIMQPQKIPQGLNLLRTVNYPSGEPAFYFFSKDVEKVVK